MQVAKWGNSLAIRIPASVVDALGLKEGDDVTVRVANGAVFEIERDETRQKALEKIKSFKWELPPGWKFDRDEANSR